MLHIAMPRLCPQWQRLAVFRLNGQHRGHSGVRSPHPSVGIVHIGSFGGFLQSGKSTKVLVALFRTVGGPITGYGSRLP